MTLCWGVDKLYRTLQDLICFLNEIYSVNCDLYIHQSVNYISTPSGKMMFQTCVVFAEFEIGMIRERVISAQNRAKEQCRHIGKPTNLNDWFTTSIKFMRKKGMGIRRIAKDLKSGVLAIKEINQFDRTSLIKFFKLVDKFYMIPKNLDGSFPKRVFYFLYGRKEL